MLTIILIASFCANGQSGMADSVKVPAKWLKEGMKDLIRYDQCKEEVSLLKSSNANLNTLNEKNVLFANLQQQRVEDMRLRWNECMKQGDLMQSQHNKEVHDLQNALKKQKRKSTWGVIGGVGSGIVVGVITGLIISN